MWKSWWRGRLQAATPHFAAEARGVFESALAAARVREATQRELFDQLAFALRMAESEVPIDRATIPLSLAWEPERVKELAGQLKLSPYLKTNLRALVAHFREDQRTLARAEAAQAELAGDPALHVKAEAVETALGLFHFLASSREQFRDYPLVFALLGGAGRAPAPAAEPGALSASFVSREPEAPEAGGDFTLDGAWQDALDTALLEIEPAPLLLEVGLDLVPLVDPALGGGLMAGLQPLRARVARALGWVMPGVAFRPGTWAGGPQRYRLLVRGTPAAEGELLPGFLLLHETPESPRLDPDAWIGFAARHPVSGRAAVWVNRQEAQRAQAQGYGLADPVSLLLELLETTVRRAAHGLFTLDDAGAMIEALQERAPYTVEAVYPARLDLTTCWAVLRRLLREQVSLGDLQAVFEHLALAVRSHQPAYQVLRALEGQGGGPDQLALLDALQQARFEPDPRDLAEAVRRGLGRALVAPLLDGAGTLDVVTLEPALEQALRAACALSPNGTVLRLGLGEREAVIQALHTALAPGDPPVLLVQDALRPFLFEWLAPGLSDLVVLAHGEIPPEVRVRSVREALALRR